MEKGRLYCYTFLTASWICKNNEITIVLCTGLLPSWRGKWQIHHSWWCRLHVLPKEGGTIFKWPDFQNSTYFGVEGKEPESSYQINRYHIISWYHDMSWYIIISWSLCSDPLEPIFWLRPALHRGTKSKHAEENINLTEYFWHGGIMVLIEQKTPGICNAFMTYTSLFLSRLHNNFLVNKSQKIKFWLFFFQWTYLASAILI